MGIMLALRSMKRIPTAIGYTVAGKAYPAFAHGTPRPVPQ